MKQVFLLPFFLMLTQHKKKIKTFKIQQGDIFNIEQRERYGIIFLNFFFQIFDYKASKI